MERSTARKRSLVLSKRASRLRRVAALLGHGVLLCTTSASTLAVIFIFIYIARDAIPFFTEGEFLHRAREFFTGTNWYPSREPGEFGAASLFVGTAMVTLGAAFVAVPLGVLAAACLSDVLPFTARQFIKPVIEILAAIPSVAYGFFALVVFAPLLQKQGSHLLALASWGIGTPLACIAVVVAGDVLTGRLSGPVRRVARVGVTAGLAALAFRGLTAVAGYAAGLDIDSGTNALNVSIILGIMALPTVVSVAEDALQAVGRDLREGSYALGATRAETLVKVVMPAASSGICAAVILGVMRAVGETMVVWMASGNAVQEPANWFHYLKPVRTLTATIAGDMGEADQLAGPSGAASPRYHVLFVMALCLLIIAFICNLASEYAARRTRRKLGGR